MSSINCVLAIPRSGRTFENFINTLSQKILTEDNTLSQNLAKVVEAVAQGKKYKSSDLNVVMNHLNEIPIETRNALSVFIDRKREVRPYRVGFLAKDFAYQGFHYRIEGDEPHNCSSLVALGEADIALAGWDELLNVKQSLLSDKSITKWGMYNYHLPKESKVRIAGSAMLKRWNKTLKTDIQDFVGFFLIAKEQPNGHVKGYPRNYLQHIEETGHKVFVKGRYEDIVRVAFPKLNIQAVHDVEDAVVDSEQGSVGLEIVQTGNTLKRKNLVLLGHPLFISESLYVANYFNYDNTNNSSNANSSINTSTNTNNTADNDDENHNNANRTLLDALEPKDYFDKERIHQFALWYLALETNVGENWIHKPSVDEIFFSDNEVDNGLRPVRLKTRYWKPSDSYKLEDAKKATIEAKAVLISSYQRFSANYLATNTISQN